MGTGSREPERETSGPDRSAEERTTVLPPEAFDDTYAEPDPRFRSGGRGPECDGIAGLLAGRCAGWPQPPTARELYDAMRAKARTARQKAIVRVLITEGTADTVALGYLDGAYTWRQLARAMHEQKHYDPELARYVNRHASQGLLNALAPSTKPSKAQGTIPQTAAEPEGPRPAEPEVRNLDLEVEDNRQMCFEQGKACVYMPDEEGGIILTEWPNGTVDSHDLGAETTTRRWPDGAQETRSDREPFGYPHWPRQPVDPRS